MKGTWTQPRARVSQFVANEYVAACWRVRCSINGADKVTPTMPINTGDTFYVQHGKGNCGSYDHYDIKFNNGVATSMTEIKHTYGFTDMKCEFYTNSSYTSIKSISEVTPGQTVYWTTDQADDRGNKITWHHEGMVEATTNHS